MARFAGLFVILCMAVVAISLGIVVRLQFGFGLAESLLVTLAFLAVFLVIQLHSTRRRDYDEMMDRADEVERQNDLVLEDLRNLEKRLSALEANSGKNNFARDLEPVIGEVEVLGTIVKQIAETMAEFEQRLVTQENAPPPLPMPRAQAPNRAPSSPAAREPDPVDEPVADPGPPEIDPALIDKVRQFIDAGKVDLYLQPIVTLPQRKTRYYEALTRLRFDDGEMMTPADFLPAAERAGVIPVLDNLLLLRSVQIVRRLTSRNKDAGIFCNISPTSIADTNFFDEFITFMESNRELSSHLVFEFTQKTVRGMGPVEFESLEALVDLGYRLSVDQVEDLRMDLGNLSNRGFRFAKLSAERMLSGTVDLGGDIHVEDLSKLMERNNIELIVDKIENEAQVLDLLDFQVHLAQGFLFSPPRPVRADVFQGYSSPPEEPKRLAAG